MPDWHYQHRGEAKGPVTDDQLKALCDAGVVSVSTPVWRQGFVDWTTLGDTDFSYVHQSSRTVAAGGSGSVPRAGSGHGAGHVSDRASAPTERYLRGSVDEAYDVDDLSMWRFFVRCLTERYAMFTGRARRKEYWSFVLFYIVTVVAIFLGGSLIDAAVGNIGPENVRSAPVVTLAGYILFSLAMLIPGLSVLVRRLHDIGLSGWLVLIGIIPLGGLALLIMALIPTQFGPNRHGPAPLAPPGG